MPQMVELPDDILLKLHHRTPPFSGLGPVDVIRLMLGNKNEKPGASSEPSLTTSWAVQDARVLDPKNPGGLTHTKVLEASFANYSASHWNELVAVAHQLAWNQLGTYERVRAATIANIVKGDRSTEGYHPIPGTGLSLQYLQAELSWSRAFHLAKQMNVPVKVLFVWRDKPGSAYPNERGVLQWSPE